MNKKDPFNPLEKSPLLIVISGPSGVGKDTVIGCMKDRSLPFHFVVTATTRPPREGEVHGVDYFFVSSDEFAAMIEQDELIEYAIVYNDYKGIPKAQVRQALHTGNDVIMRIDVQGAETIREVPRSAVDLPDDQQRRRDGQPAEDPQIGNAGGPEPAHCHGSPGAEAGR